MQSLTLSNLRIQRLRELIKDDKTGRENMALLTKHKLELDRMKHLVEIGAVSSSRYHRVLVEFLKQEARTVENVSPEFKALYDEALGARSTDASELRRAYLYQWGAIGDTNFMKVVRKWGLSL